MSSPESSVCVAGVEGHETVDLRWVGTGMSHNVLTNEQNGAVNLHSISLKKKSGTALIQIPMGQKKVSLLVR